LIGISIPGFSRLDHLFSFSKWNELPPAKCQVSERSPQPSHPRRRVSRKNGPFWIPAPRLRGDRLHSAGMTKPQRMRAMKPIGIRQRPSILRRWLVKKMILVMVCFFGFLAIAFPAVADRDNYSGHHGYKEHPYERSRHYEPYDHEGHRYDYHGHWRSWNDWDDYARHHPWMYNDGRYYHEGGHLMFRVCEPGTPNCFFFSIGR
jgi:hypothetical protein